MRMFAVIRAAGIGGLATAAAVAAHGGSQLASDPLWLLAGLAGALAALVAGRLCWRLASAAGELPATLPLPLLAAALLGVQVGAHAGLLAAGAPAHAGAAGSLALHAVLALAAALLVRLLESGAARMLVARAGLRPQIVAARRRPPRLPVVPAQRTSLPVGGRAPPEPA
jgi:hypothetical protein